jgi:hypothetical protein
MFNTGYNQTVMGRVIVSHKPFIISIGSEPAVGEANDLGETIFLAGYLDLERFEHPPSKVQWIKKQG